MNIIGFDFSINKPAACILSNNCYNFISWPYGISDKIVQTYRDAGVNIIDRIDNKDKGKNITDKMRYEIENSRYIAILIRESIESYLNNTTYIVFEGFSYASSGDVVIQLGGYKYILMNELAKYVPIENMFTYSPITLKSTAECAKRGMDKSDMINKFILDGPDCILRNTLLNNPDIFKTPKSKKWIIHMDDLIDSYWAIETLRKKEDICLTQFKSAGFTL